MIFGNTIMTIYSSNNIGQWATTTRKKLMINYAYGQRNQYNSTPVRTILCGLVFADLTAFFFLSFMNICFDTIVSDPPVWLLFILFMVMALDLFA